jgi:hypothetical protein
MESIMILSIKNYREKRGLINKHGMVIANQIEEIYNFIWTVDDETTNEQEIEKTFKYIEILKTLGYTRIDFSHKIGRPCFLTFKTLMLLAIVKKNKILFVKEEEIEKEDYQDWEVLEGEFKVGSTVFTLMSEDWISNLASSKEAARIEMTEGYYQLRGSLQPILVEEKKLKTIST